MLFRRFSCIAIKSGVLLVVYAALCCNTSALQTSSSEQDCLSKIQSALTDPTQRSTTATDGSEQLSVKVVPGGWQYKIFRAQFTPFDPNGRYTIFDSANARLYKGNSVKDIAVSIKSSLASSEVRSAYIMLDNFSEARRENFLRSLEIQGAWDESLSVHAAPSGSTFESYFGQGIVLESPVEKVAIEQSIARRGWFEATLDFVTRSAQRVRLKVYARTKESLRAFLSSVQELFATSRTLDNMSLAQVVTLSRNRVKAKYPHLSDRDFVAEVMGNQLVLVMRGAEA